jgi:hypothetical protein
MIYYMVIYKSNNIIWLLSSRYIVHNFVCYISSAIHLSIFERQITLISYGFDVHIIDIT